ncbi:MAG: hypothetical protein AAFQ14_16885 [Cyanobacteria bacterium J06621_12]
MVLNQLKKIRDELRDSAEVYDAAFKNVAIIAAEELVQSEQNLRQDSKQQLNTQQHRASLNSVPNKLDKKYFLNRYGSLKNAKAAYTQAHGQQNYGRSWADFVTVAKKLASPKPQTLTLEERITKIEEFLCSLGYQL